MSKAFTSEETADEVIPGRAVKRARAGERRPITAEGHRALSEALQRLQAGKPTAPEGQQRLQQLAAVLDSVEVLPAQLEPGGGAGFGCQVTALDGEGRTVRYRLVGPDEADVKVGALSIASPLAQALLGRKVGDVVEVERPSGLLELTLTAVELGAR